MFGHVTSSYWSETLGRSIALAVVEGGRAREGQTIHVSMPDKIHAAQIAVWGILQAADREIALGI